MSGTPPVVWLASKDYADLLDAENGCDALQECASISRGDTKLRTDDVPLYSATQLVEAVVAERARCAKVCEGKISGTFPDICNPTDADHRQIAWDAACEELAEAIRSATK